MKKKVCKDISLNIWADNSVTVVHESQAANVDGQTTAIVFRFFEIDAIHAAIHPTPEPEAVESNTCGNCFYSGEFYNHEAHCYRCPPTKGSLRVDRGMRACGEHRRKE